MNSESPSQLAPGTLLADGKYEILEAVGSGGMGQVYKARHRVLNRTVAIKVLHPVMTAFPKAKARFLREARAASRLSHPCSVQIIDFGSEHDAFFYLVMEFLEGVELSRIIEDHAPLPSDMTISIISQVCGALAAAHDEGIIHRDLKPANIMVADAIDDDGRPYQAVKVCDFGIAKIQSDGDDSTGEAQLTDTGVVTGTPTYMSPEQARGKPLDARSDIYACGVILYQMLTGTLPFKGENALGVLMQHISDTPERPSVLEPTVDSGLEAIALKCLSKSPEDRYHDARALRAALLSSVDLSIPLSLPARHSGAAAPSAPPEAGDPAPFAGPMAFGKTVDARSLVEKSAKRSRGIALAIGAVSAAIVGAFLYALLPSEAEDTGVRRSAVVGSKTGNPGRLEKDGQREEEGDEADQGAAARAKNRGRKASGPGGDPASPIDLGTDSDEDAETETETETLSDDDSDSLSRAIDRAFDEQGEEDTLTPNPQSMDVIDDGTSPDEPGPRGADKETGSDKAPPRVIIEGKETDDSEG